VPGQRAAGSGQRVEAALFRAARIKLQNPDRFLDHSALPGIWQQRIKLYVCGTPRTTPLVSNPFIDLDEAWPAQGLAFATLPCKPPTPCPCNYRRQAQP
jgi:hypothetical protein